MDYDENRDDDLDLGLEEDTDGEDWGPMDACVRLSPGERQGLSPCLAWVERYDRLVVTRYTEPGDPHHSMPDGTTREIGFPTVAQAIREIEYRVADLVLMGYEQVQE